MFPSIRRLPVVRSALTLIAVCAVLLAGLASPAQASNHPTSAVGPINTTTIDLGLLATFTNQPVGAAAMVWNRSGSAVSPRLVGYLSMSGAAGYCGSVRMRYYLGNTLVAEEYSLPLCPAGNGLVGQTVAAGTFNNLLITSVIVEVGLDPWAFPGGWQPWHTVFVYV